MATLNDELETASEKRKSVISCKSRATQSRFCEDELDKLQKTTDHGTLTPNTSRKSKTHSRSSSTTFEEYSGGYKQHTRGQSWSQSGTLPHSSASFRRKSYESSTLMVGIHGNQTLGTSDKAPHGEPHRKIKTKIKTNKRFDRIILAQTLALDSTHTGTSEYPVSQLDDKNAHEKHPLGAIWTTRFSKDGKYMATGGQDCVVKVWQVLRDKEQQQTQEEPSIKVFHDTPVRIFVGHTADVLDISWSKNNFLVSSSMDKTVRLWHVSQNVCLCVFRHLDVVTSVKFHPKDDRFFLSGSLDCKVRLWSIPEKRVAFWNEIPSGNMVTAIGFSLDGRTTCVGANTGDVFFFETQGLKYNTQILVKRYRHKHGKKVTGIEPMPGMPLGEERMLVTTNDSRIWIINMKDKSYVAKYKGLVNPVMQIRASFSDDGRYIVSGSEDGCVYLWCTDQVNYSPFHHMHESRVKAAANVGHLGDHMLQTVLQYNDQFQDTPLVGGVSGWLKKGEQKMVDKLRSRNEHFLAHDHIVTCAIFAPTKTRQQLARSKGDLIFENTPIYTHREIESDVDSAYGDNHHRRKSRISLSPSSHCRDTGEFQQALIDKFEEATPEERDQFDFPDSQIIISTDYHGSIKVWRMDSGIYNEEDYENIVTPNHSKRSAVTPCTAPIMKSNTSKNIFSTFFSKLGK